MDRSTLITAAGALSKMRATPHNGADWLFLNQLFDLAEDHRRAQIDLAPLVAFTDAPFVFTQGPLAAALSKCADRTEAMELSRNAGIVRDLIVQTLPAADFAYRVPRGFFSSLSGIHHRTVTPRDKMQAVHIVLEQLGHTVEQTELGFEPSADQEVLWLEDIGWRRPLPAGAAYN